jgi:predicted dehydrogenase
MPSSVCYLSKGAAYLMSQGQENLTTRRELIRNAAVTTTAGVVAASLMPTTAEGMRRVFGANDRIHIAHVGVGTQGFSAHVRLLKQAEKENNTQQIASCDLYGRRNRDAQKELGLSNAHLYSDFRKMLEKEKPDAVVVATSDNWHAPVSIACMEAGAHVYCEKPMCKTLTEAFAVYDTVKKTGKKFQVGSQGCSDEKYRAVAKIVRSGSVGHLVVAQGNYMRNGTKGEWNDYGRFDLDAGPNATGDAHVDWDTFRKGTKPVDWDPDRYFRWRKYWEYGTGLVGDLFPHKLHPLFIAMGLPTDGLRGFPVRVSSCGGLYVQKIHDPSVFLPDKDAAAREKAYLNRYHPGKKWPDREVPDFINLNVDFEDCSLMAMSSTINEEGWPDSIRCNKATILFSGDTIEVKPERVWAEEVDSSKAKAPGDGEHIETHQKNWLNCIRNNGTPNGNIDIAIRVQVMISLAERSYRESKTFTFDPKTRTATG